MQPPILRRSTRCVQYLDALEQDMVTNLTVSTVVECLPSTEIFAVLRMNAHEQSAQLEANYVSIQGLAVSMILLVLYMQPCVPHVQKRNASKGQRSKENRQSADRLATGKGPEGDTEWEKAISLINFGFARPNGSDLSRFKNALFAAKSRNVPITSHVPNTEKA